MIWDYRNVGPRLVSDIQSLLRQGEIMPRIENRIVRADYDQFDERILRVLEQAVQVVASLHSKLAPNHISVEWIVLERAVNVPTLTLDVIYSTGEWESPDIRERMPAVIVGLRKYLVEVRTLFPQGVKRTTAVWDRPQPDARYEEDS